MAISIQILKMKHLKKQFRTLDPIHPVLGIIRLWSLREKDLMQWEWSN